jgi:hypothetical protein
MRSGPQNALEAVERRPRPRVDVRLYPQGPAAAVEVNKIMDPARRRDRDREHPRARDHLAAVDSPRPPGRAGPLGPERFVEGTQHSVMR